ncbi:MAG: ester cyclase [Leptothrix sp. (in: b-proteobacteria)]
MAHRDTPDPVALSRRYIEAWRQHDPGAILATMAPGGTYRDPTTPGPISGEHLRGYAGALFAGFPDLGFSYRGPFLVGEHEVHMPWTMTGTHTGHFNGMAPTGRRVTLEGFDVMEASPQGLRSVVGYFDTGTLIRALTPPEAAAATTAAPTPREAPIGAYARLVHTHYKPEDVEAVTALWRDETMPVARKQAGFMAGQLYVDRKTGLGLSLVTWETAAHASATSEHSAYLQQVLARYSRYFIEAPRVQHFELVARG